MDRPHDPKKEQDKSPQNNQECHFGGHPVSPSSKLELKFSKKHRIEIRFFSKDIKQFIAVKFIEYKIL